VTGVKLLKSWRWRCPWGDRGRAPF